MICHPGALPGPQTEPMPEPKFSAEPYLVEPILRSAKSGANSRSRNYLRSQNFRRSQNLPEPKFSAEPIPEPISGAKSGANPRSQIRSQVAQPMLQSKFSVPKRVIGRQFRSGPSSAIWLLAWLRGLALASAPRIGSGFGPVIWSGLGSAIWLRIWLRSLAPILAPQLGPGLARKFGLAPWLLAP